MTDWRLFRDLEKGQGAGPEDRPALLPIRLEGGAVLRIEANWMGGQVGGFRMDESRRFLADPIGWDGRGGFLRFEANFAPRGLVGGGEGRRGRTEEARYRFGMIWHVPKVLLKIETRLPFKRRLAACKWNSIVGLHRTISSTGGTDSVDQSDFMLANRWADSFPGNCKALSVLEILVVPRGCLGRLTADRRAKVRKRLGALEILAVPRPDGGATRLALLTTYIHRDTLEVDRRH